MGFRPCSGGFRFDRSVCVGKEMTSLAPIAAEEQCECVVIDDDPDICTLISRVLSKIGVSSVGLSSADALASALETIRPSIVFLDVALDRSDAIDGIRILRQTRFDGAVQLISGKDSELLNNIKAIGERNGLQDARSAAESRSAPSTCASSSPAAMTPSGGTGSRRVRAATTSSRWKSEPSCR